MSSHPLGRLLCAAALASLAACGPRSGHPADRALRSSPDDGALVSLPFGADEARAVVADLLEAQGYVVSDETGIARPDRPLWPEPKQLGADTTIALRVDFATAEYPGASGPSTIVAFSGTYSVPTAGVRAAQIVAPPGAPERLWAELQALAEALRREVRQP